MTTRVRAAGIAITVITGALVWWQSQTSPPNASREGSNPKVTTNHIPQPRDSLASAEEAIIPSEKSPRQSHKTSSTGDSTGTPIAEQLNSAYETIPRITDLKDLTDANLHHTPQALLAAAKILGDVLDLEEDNPNAHKTFVAFYGRCSGDAEFPETLRAMCVSHYLRTANLSPQDKDTFLEGLPRLVRALYEQL